MNDRFQLDATGSFNPRQRIPNYDEIAREETESRNDAMLGLADTLCGLKVKPLTWRHLLWLDIYQSPFLMDAPPEMLLQIPDIHLHVARFMWVCSPDWKPFSAWARKIYFFRYRRTLYEKKPWCPTFRRWLSLKPVASGLRPDPTEPQARPYSNTEKIVRAIHKFVDDSLWDLKADSGGGARRKSYYSSSAPIIHLLCEKYGALSPDPNAKNAAIDLSLKIVSQMLRVQIRMQDPKALMSNRTDELERDWLAELNKKLRKN